MIVTKKELTSEELLVNKTFWILCAISRISEITDCKTPSPKEIINYCKDHCCQIDISEDDIHNIFKMAYFGNSKTIMFYRYQIDEANIGKTNVFPGNPNILGYGCNFHSKSN